MMDHPMSWKAFGDAGEEQLATDDAICGQPRGSDKSRGAHSGVRRNLVRGGNTTQADTLVQPVGVQHYACHRLLNLQPDRELVVSYRFVPLNTHALQVVREKGFEGLTTWSSCSLPLNGILRLRDEKTLEQAHGLVTTLPVQEAMTKAFRWWCMLGMSSASFTLKRLRPCLAHRRK